LSISLIYLRGLSLPATGTPPHHTISEIKMTYEKISLPLQSLDTATDDVKPILEGVHKKFGKIPNIVATMANAPVTLQNYAALGANFANAGFKPAEQQIIFLTISVENGCDYCTAAHSTALKGGFKMPAEIVAAIRDNASTGDVERDALIETVRELVRGKGYLSAQTRDAFLAAGYTLTQLIDLLSAIAMKTLTNYLHPLPHPPPLPANPAQAFKPPPPRRRPPPRHADIKRFVARPPPPGILRRMSGRCRRYKMTHPTKPLSGPLVLLMATAISATAANLYYSQPLVPAIGETFGLSEGSMGLIPSAAQLGYAAAILLISPLGDTMSRRTLISYLSVLLTLALLGIWAAPSFGVLIAAAIAVGLGANITQQLIPLGAALSTPEHRGRIMGTLMTGLTIGILLSRTVSGSIAEYFGWRSVFLFAAILASLFGVLLRMNLPSNRPKVTLSYPALIASMFGLVRRHKLLRESALTGALWFAAFNALWATLAIHVTGEPLNYGVQQAGLFGLVGLAGIFGAKLAGRLVDSQGPARIITAALGLVTAAFVVLFFWGESLGGLIVGVILLDLGVFGAQIPNQVRVFSIDPNAQSRMNAVYMLGYYLAAAIGSAGGVKVMSIAGWHGVAVFGLLLAITALLHHLIRNMRKIMPAHPSAAG
jgi:AhpD family alkylhydroperoxidase